ncbi:hypothetical protein LTR86_006154 [Recurvomyces mirabilis]|nr:hypothetical protein LTR86_006154 [Recurvomyces mirabilis]
MLHLVSTPPSRLLIEDQIVCPTDTCKRYDRVAAYGPANAQQLVVDAPALARANADNYVGFAVEVFLGSTLGLLPPREIVPTPLGGPKPWDREMCVWVEGGKEGDEGMRGGD